MQKSFQGNSPQFFVSLLTFVFATLTLLGIELPTGAEALATETVSVFTSQGIFGVIGVMGSAFVGIGLSIYTKWTSKQLTFSGLFGSVNFWLNAAAFVTAIAMYQGVGIPSDALPSLVYKVHAGDYFGAVAILVGSILNPLIRFIRDLRQSEAVEQ